MGKPQVAYRKQLNNQLKSKESISSVRRKGSIWTCLVKTEPQEEGAGYEFRFNQGGVVPKEHIPFADKGIKETMNSGVLAGFQWLT